MKKGFVIGVVLALILIGGFWLANDSDVYEGVNERDYQEDGEDDSVGVPEGGIRQEADLEPVGDYTGSGTATSSYVDGVYTHNVVANIGDPAEGKFYEGWLAGGFGFISTGMLEKEGDQYVLEFTSDEDLTSKYSKVVITEETLADGLDNRPEAHVIEGPWK